MAGGSAPTARGRKTTGQEKTRGVETKNPFEVQGAFTLVAQFEPYRSRLRDVGTWRVYQVAGRLIGAIPPRLSIDSLDLFLVQPRSKLNSFTGTVKALIDVRIVIIPWSIFTS